MAKKPEPKALATNCQRTRVVDDGKPGKWPSGLDLGMPNTSPGRLLGEVKPGMGGTVVFPDECFSGSENSVKAAGQTMGNG